MSSSSPAPTERRRRRESTDGPAIETVSAPEPGRPDLAWLLDEEILRLPERLRLPVVLCLMEGRTYDEAASQDLYFSAPLQFVPGLSGPQLDRLRQRFVLLASGEGDWEDVDSSWRMADCLGARGIPNRVDNWGPQWPHEWPTWRRMLPQYLRELT